MTNPVTDSRLLKLLRGELEEPEQNALENAIETDIELRQRWESICHASDWPIGNVPCPSRPKSERLLGVMAQLVAVVEQDIFTDTSNQPSVPPNSNSDSIARDYLLSPVAGLSGIRIVRELGRGGMGIVYEGYDQHLQRRVAIKQLLPQHYDNGGDDRLLREAQAIANLQHENILSVYGVSVVEGVPVIVQQFVDGQSLQQRLQQSEPLPLPLCIDYARQIAKGLATAHTAGVIHRDLKPANILLQENTNQLLIADFGLAKRPQADLTITKLIAGTPAYMSPEQSRGNAIDHRSDLFSLGTILYRMVTGKLPFDHQDAYALLEMIRQSEPVSPASQRPDVPEWLSSCILRLLAKDPSERIQSAEDLIALIDQQSLAAPLTTQPNQRAATLIIGLTGLVVLFGLLAKPWLFPEQQPTGTQISNIQSRAVSEFAEDTSVPAVRGIARTGIWIEGSDEIYSELVEAIAVAPNGATIRVGGDCQASGIVIQEKQLTIEAAEGSRPQITCQDPNDGSAAKFLIRANSDLTLRGLTIDWRPKENVPLFSEGRISSVVFGSVGTNLLIENCEISSNQTGAVVGVAGDATIQDSGIFGGDFAFGWMALQSHATLRHCSLRSDVGVGVVYPPVGVATQPNTTLELIDSVFLCRTAIDFALTRKPERRIEIKAADCQFEGSSVLTLRVFLTERLP